MQISFNDLSTLFVQIGKVQRERERKINILKNNTKKLKQQKYKTKIQWSNKAIKQQHGRQNKNP